MTDALEAKRAVFARASAFLRHVTLRRFRNGYVDVTLPPMHAADLNAVEPACLIDGHTNLAHLEMTAVDPNILRIYLAILSPVPGEAYSPVGLLAEFVAATRAELGLPPVQVDGHRLFPLNLDCNAIVMAKIPSPVNVKTMELKKPPPK
jgi:hypothetical protein